jgi:MerR family transcriptional regulator/heat shock protein HspR
MAEQRQARQPDGPEGTYSREVTCVLAGISTIRLGRYERAQLVAPQWQGKLCYYRAEDVKRLRKVHRLEDDLGINLAGIEVVLRLGEQLEALQRRLAAYEASAGAP